MYQIHLVRNNLRIGLSYKAEFFIHFSRDSQKKYILRDDPTYIKKKKKKFRQPAFTLTLYVLWFLVLFHFFLKAGHDPLNWFYKPEIGFNTKYKKVFFPFDPIPLNLIITSSIWEEGTGLLLKQRIPPWFWCLQKQNASLNYIISTNQVFDKMKVFVFSLQNFT